MGGRHWQASHKELVQTDGWTPDLQITGSVRYLPLGQLHSLTVTIIIIYGPNTDDVSLFKKLDEYLGSNDEKTFIIGGDFNTILDVELDKKNGIKYTHPNIRKKLLSIIDENYLKDIWRI